jgi:nucleoside-diphosphate-sugar epimerase
VGFTGSRVAAELKADGWRVIGTVRSAASAERLRVQLGIEMLVFDGGSAGAGTVIEALAQATHVLLTAQPSESGDPVLCNPTLREAVAASAERLQWVGYLSSVGVYGDAGGAEVDEDRPPAPKSRRSIYRLAAEQQWQELKTLPLRIFRLPGIYGPGRGPIEKVRGGTARCLTRGDPAVDKQQLFSRIHVDDISLVVRHGSAARVAASHLT